MSDIFDWTGDGTWDSIEEYIRLQIGEPDEDRYDESKIRAWAAAAVMETAVKGECIRRFCEWSTTEANSGVGTGQTRQLYRLTDFTGRRVVKVGKIVMGEGSSEPYTNWRPLSGMSWTDAMGLSDIDSLNGTPTHYFLKTLIGTISPTAYALGLYPIPSVDTYRIRGDFAVLPAWPLSTAIHQLPPEAFTAFLLHIQWQHRIAEDEYGKATGFRNEFKREVKKLKFEMQDAHVRQDGYSAGRYSSHDLKMR